MGHWMPVVRPNETGQQQDRLLAITGFWRFNGTSGDLVDPSGPDRFGEWLGGQELAGSAVEYVEETVLWRLHEHFACCSSDRKVCQNDGLGGGEVPTVAGRDLVVPDVGSGVGAKSDDRGEIQVVAAAGTAEIAVPGRAVSRADVEEIELGIVFDGVPDGATAAQFPPLAGPCLHGLFERLAFELVSRVAGDLVEAPCELAGGGVISGDVAANAEFGSPVSMMTLPLTTRGAPVMV